MGSDTVMLEWKSLMSKIQKANASDTLKLWSELKEHEAYMTNKGYVITINRVKAPNGETVWERLS